MPTTSKPLLTRKIGHVPFTSVMGKNAKGRFIASTKMNGEEFVGEGDSERHATLDLKKVVDAAALRDKIRTSTR